MNPLYFKIAAYVITFSVGFGSAWSWQGALKDAAQLESLQETARANDAAVARAKAEKEARDLAYNTQREKEVAQARIRRLNRELQNEKENDYLINDPNAAECGLSINGVRLWNESASGLLGTSESAGPVDYVGTVAASNARVVSAARTSFDRHWDAIDQVRELQTYIKEKCRAKRTP